MELTPESLPVRVYCLEDYKRVWIVDQIDRDDEDSAAAERELKVVDVQQLFGDDREICLELEGIKYRLRITRRNKLILQKWDRQQLPSSSIPIPDYRSTH